MWDVKKNVTDFQNAFNKMRSGDVKDLPWAKELAKRIDSGVLREDIRKEHMFRDTTDAALDFAYSLNQVEGNEAKLLKHQNGMAGSLKKLGESFKMVAGNMAIMLAVTVALKTAYAIFDHFNVTAEEQQEIVDGLSTKVSDLQSQYDALDSKTNKSDAENKQLKYLKTRLEYAERQLQVEQELLAMKELYGVGDFFSNGNLEPTTYSNGAYMESIAD